MKIKLKKNTLFLIILLLSTIYLIFFSFLVNVRAEGNDTLPTELFNSYLNTSVDYTGPVSATNEEIIAANDVANKRFKFDPLKNVVPVKNWTEFKSAYNNQNVTKIIMTNNITRTDNLNNREKSLEIDGGGYVLNMGNDSLRLASTPTDNIGFFHFHDMTAKNSANEGNGGGGNMWAFVAGPNGTNIARNWYFRTGNINTTRNNGERVIRLIRGTRSEITVYGKLNLITTSENFYVGSMIIEDGTNWYGEDTGSNYSVIWFEQNSSGSDTGSAQKFEIGKRAQVVLKNSTNGTAYPAVYSYYDKLTVGENSIYNANMNGNSVRFDRNNSSMTIKKNAVSNLLSRGNGSVVQFNTDGSSLNVEPEGSLYVVGSTTSAVVDITSGNNKTLTLDTPKGYDIRNTNDGNGRNSPAASTANVSTNVINIKNSDIDLWNLGTALMGPSQSSYALVTNFSAKANGGSTNVTTTEPGLESFTSTNYRRIAGMNALPELEWIPVTDADKTYKTRIKIGMTPTGSFDDSGNAILEPVYASEKQAFVEYTDTYDKFHKEFSNSQGYAIKTDKVFNIAGKNIKAKATRGPWISEDTLETTVLDVTPPEPAVLTEGKVTNATKQLIGKNAEPKAKIYVDINEKRQSDVGIVEDDGSWTYNLTSYLSKGDTVQIFLEDNAGKVTQNISPAAPSTNSSQGNINPKKDMNYRDATFKAATKYTVEDVLPDKPLLTKKVSSSGGETTQVGDTLTYTINTMNNKASSFTTNWKDVVIRDTLPEGLSFSKETSNLKLNDTLLADNEYNYSEDNRLLEIPIGDLKSQQSAEVSFNVKLNSSSVGKVITNKAIATGSSPREKEEYSAEDSVSTEEVFGTVEILSFPNNINFGTISYTGSVIKVDNGTYDNDLIISDTRARKEKWTLGAKLIKQMAKIGEEKTELTDSLQYVNGDKITVLSKDLQPVYQSSSKDLEGNDFTNVSKSWGTDKGSNGLKLVVDPSKSKMLKGEYEGIIEWQLMEATP